MTHAALRGAIWLLIALVLAGCTPARQGESATSSAAPEARVPVPSAAAPEPEPPPVASAQAVEAPAEEPAEEPPPPKPVEPVPTLVDEAGEPLPQTDDRPSADSPSFEARLELLVEAIRKDDPKLALPAFFPVLAYSQVKAIAKPERDWEHRLVGAFERNIHEYHQRLGEAAGDVKLLGIEIPEAQIRFMKPNSEGNRIGYYRVLRSRLRLEKPDATEVGLEITSLISWRGEWYVVHLHGFK